MMQDVTIFWAVAAGLSLVVAALIAGVAWRRRDRADTSSASDIQVYRDQLREIERDAARGVLDADEAERVRIEVSRRLLEADRAARTEASAHGSIGPLGAVAVAAAVVASSLALFAYLATPLMPDEPLTARLAAADKARADRPAQAAAEAQVGDTSREKSADPKFVELVNKLRAAMQERPDDERGLMLLARNEALLGNFKAAYQAQQHLIEVKGERATADDYTALAEGMILAAGGYISPEAEAALTAALQRNPKDGVAGYYSGLLFAQTGRPDIAFDIWRALLENGKPDAPWVEPIRANIEQVAAEAGIRYQLPDATASGAPGPSAADVAAAQNMSAADREQMIRGMVDRLSDRLATDGGTGEEWARLIRALGVLGETDRAKQALAEGRKALANAPDELAKLEAAAAQAGLGQ